jgi:hypothetical protein
MTGLRPDELMATMATTVRTKMAMETSRLFSRKSRVASGRAAGVEHLDRGRRGHGLSGVSAALARS